MIRTENQKFVGEPLINRRKALQLLGSGIASFLTGILVGHEAKTQLQGCTETSLGRFYDYPERHDYRTIYQDSLELPDTCAGYMAECVVTPKKFFSKNILEVLLNFLIGKDTIPSSIQFAYSDAVLSKLAATETPILIGDYNFADIAQDAKYDLPNLVLGLRVLLGSCLATGLGVYLTKEALQHRFSQRSKLKATLAGTALFLDIPLIERLLGTHQWFQDRYTNNNLAYRRALSRIDGLLTHLQPENVNTFFRNLYVAHKLLFYAQTIKQNEGSVSNFLYQYHGGHNSIQDFLILGIDACEELLLLFPADFLKIMIHGCGGLRGFCSIRAVTLTPDFAVQREAVCNIDEEKFPEDTYPGSHTYYLHKIQGGISKDQIITNMEFAAKLQHKLG